MKWNRLTVRTITDAEDVIIASLAEIGLEGAQIEDSMPLTEEEKEQMFVDIMPEGPADDGKASISFYIEEDRNLEEVKNQVDAVLNEIKGYMDIGEGTVEISETEDIDWINNWKEYFHQFYVDDILVIPSWEEIKPEDEGKLTLHIDPGTAFGTGMHETTQLVIRQIKKHIKEGDEILDVGTGSGILAILALMMGARHALGTDLDPCAVSAVEENKASNNIPDESFDLVIGNLIDDPEVQEKAGKEKYDIVTANILADVLLPLTPVIVPCLKKGGIYICSGILDTREQDVLQTIENAGLETLEVTRQGEWVSVTAIRKG